MCSTLLVATCLVLGAIVSTSEGVKHSKTLVGCYQDFLPRAFPNYHGDAGHTIEGCYKKAIELGYNMFAIQHGGECWMDDLQKNKYDMYGPSDKCVGDMGGPFANSVYRVKTFCTRETAEGLCCEFPFIYGGESYYSCTTAGSSSSSQWCSTTENYDEDGDWGWCTDPCPEGWKLFKTHCYKLFDNQLRTWADARAECKYLGADLVKIRNPTENKFVASFEPSFAHKNFWIGLRRGSDNKFYWGDGAKIGFSNWAKGEPNNLGNVEGCGELVTGEATWNDVRCSRKLSYVCQKAI